MSSDNTDTGECQVDFYVLTDAATDAIKVSCTLALTMLERNQRIFITAADDSAARQIDELMWQHPEGRFLPHALADSTDAGKALVNIGTLSALKPVDVVINLCPEVIPQPERFKRILEIVPFADADRKASRVKFRAYREHGLTPRTQEINKQQPNK